MISKSGIEPVIPPKSNRKELIDFDREAYKRRNVIERCIVRASRNHHALSISYRPLTR